MQSSVSLRPVRALAAAGLLVVLTRCAGGTGIGAVEVSEVRPYVVDVQLEGQQSVIAAQVSRSLREKLLRSGSAESKDDQVIMGFLRERLRADVLGRQLAPSPAGVVVYDMGHGGDPAGGVRAANVYCTSCNPVYLCEGFDPIRGCDLSYISCVGCRLD